MKLPDAEKALVPRKKLTHYLLSETHPVGKSKARFFRNLGFNKTNVDKLEKILLSIAHNNEVESTKEASYGVNYVVPGAIRLSGNKLVNIKTVWFIQKGEDIPRFVTSIPV